MLDQGTQTDARTSAVHSPGRGKGTPLYGVTASPARVSQLWARAVELMWPWRKEQYQGYAREAAKALNLSYHTTYRWLYANPRNMSEENAAKIEALLRSRGAAMLQLAEDYRLYRLERDSEIKANKKNPPACPPGGFLTSKKR